MLGQLSKFLAMGQTMGQTKYTETKNPRSFAGSGFRVCRLAERVGFEPTVPCSTPDFESGTFDHSATSPKRPIE